MRSIRGTLTAYLLLLLAVTLGVAGVVIDQLTGRALEAREKAASDLIENQFDDRCDQERTRVDQRLLAEARDLGELMQTEYSIRNNRETAKFFSAMGFAPLTGIAFPLNPAAGVVSAASFPMASTTYPVQDSRARPIITPVSREVGRVHFTNLPLADDFIRQRIDEERVKDFIQINQISPLGGAGREWHARSLEGRVLPFDPKPFDGGKLVDWKPYATAAVVGTNELVRGVVYQTPLYLTNRRPPPPPQPRTGWLPLTFASPPPASPPAPGAPSASPATATGLEWVPKIYVQAARPQAVIDKVIAKFADERDDELTRVRLEVLTERMTLRLRIAFIGLLAFLAVGVGGPLLVARGLTPVGKLSDAVSRVSEKDFNLPHDGRNLTRELAPIHARIVQTLDQLRRAFAREKQAVGDISHELRTPIASLLATIDVSLRKPRTQDQYRATLEDCRAIARQLGHLVERIMTLATLDAGTARTNVIRCDAADLAANCAAVIRPLAEAHGLSFHLRAEPPLELETDPDKLREVLVNLLHNAVEYNQSGGRVELAGRRDGDRVVLEVRDTGIGMTPDVAERIFERFYRADSSRHATGVHAGLGLAIVKEYVDRLGGTIAVESSPDKGSTFRVSLPAADPAESEPSAPSDAPTVREAAPAGS